MPGKQITSQQEKLYMSSRQTGQTQVTAAAKAGFSERSGRTIEQGKRGVKRGQTRHWQTRKDPFLDVWDSEMVPMLEQHPSLQALTLLEDLQSRYQGKYPDSCLRTLQRRVKEWKALHGPAKEVMFRQHHEPGRQSLSDFTELKGTVITIVGKPLKHLLYHFRLAYSKWSHLKVTLGGESFSALAEGLQDALWRLGGVTLEHRTDSLSAAFKNLTRNEKEDITARYQAFCKHYGMLATRNNPGESHENGSIESPHGHIKRRIEQALLLRGSHDFESTQAYQSWLQEVVGQNNRRNAKNIGIERVHLNPLPTRKTVDYVEICARVSTAATIDVRRATYTVPSRLIGEHLRIHLYHDRLECYLGTSHVSTLARVYPVSQTKRACNVDYRHVIHSLVKKPQAFRYSRLQEQLLPNQSYKTIWQHADATLEARQACKFIVGCLQLAADFDCEARLAETVLASIAKNQLLSLTTLQTRFGKPLSLPPKLVVEQHPLNQYNTLLPKATQQEMSYATC